jgi:hypothetical protein
MADRYPSFMSVVGFRCFSSELSVVVLSGALSKPEVVEHFQCPVIGATRPEQLLWLRSEVHEILQRTGATRAAFKIAEGNAHASRRRIELEAVLQAAVAERGLLIASQTKAQVKAAIGFQGAARDIEAALPAHGLGTLSADEREAGLAALSALAHA